MKRIVVILNNRSTFKKLFYSKILPCLSEISNAEVCETRSANDAIVLSSKAVEDRVDVIFAAGGDGTLHQVVNGILNGREQVDHLPIVGLIPLGSANDFARAIQVRRNPDQIKRLLAEFNPRPIDIGKFTFLNSDTNVHYFSNIADTGMGPTVAEQMIRGKKMLGSGFAYYSAIVKTFFTYNPVEVHISSEAWNWSGKIRTLAIANGKCFGYGLYVAPNAQVDDGKFAVFIAEDVSVFDFIRYSGRLKKGEIINHPKIHYLEARTLEISSKERLMTEADGELIDQLPVRVELLEKRLPFLW